MGSHSPEKHPENVAEVLQEIAHQAEQWVRRMGPKWKETHRRDMSWDDWIGLREAIESLYEDAYGQLLCPYPEGAKELKNLYDRTVAALKPSREHPGIGALSMIPIHSLINRCRSLAQGLEGPGESSGTTPVGRRAKAQQDAVATANSSTRSTSTFTPTTTTAAPLKWYEPAKEDIPAKMKNDLGRIGRVDSIERAICEFPDIQPFWFSCGDRPEAQRIWDAIQDQWDNLRRRPGYHRVGALPSDPRKARQLMINMQQRASVEGKVPDEWADKAGERGRPLQDRFTFRPGQARFNGKDLGLNATFARDLLKKLARRIGKVVCYPTLEEDSPAKEASEKLRTAVVAIRASLKRHKTGYEITTIRGTGYCLRMKTISRSPHDNSR
jgi:hypothetical protein